ncbi:hypothetical protein O988_05211 [Pseudogymnoascus sp. VKM F-3808]|nr:hypothetical protein O988_05211 [Pseudogymnoascus sp. VKM F-3808]
MSPEYQFSEEVDPATLQRFNCFTTLPVRLHKNNDIARKAHRQFAKEWKAIIKDEKLDVDFRQSPVGHIASLALPECLPERLAFAAKALDYILAVDDATDLPSQPRPKSQTKRGIRAPQSHGWRFNTKQKHLQARLLLEGIESCGKGIMDMLGPAQAVLESLTVYSRECTSFDDYISLRIVNMGAVEIKSFVCHTMDMAPNAKERDAVYHIIKPLEVAMVLTNDYFSYPKEKALHPLQDPPGALFNAVPILMVEHGISEDDALALVKQMVIEAEQEHGMLLEELEQEGGLSTDLRQFINACRMATGGFHIWHASNPRYDVEGMREDKRSVRKIVLSWF